MSENKLGSENGYSEGQAELQANVANRSWMVTHTTVICPYQNDSPRHFEKHNMNAVSWGIWSQIPTLIGLLSPTPVTPACDIIIQYTWLLSFPSDTLTACASLSSS